MPANDSWLCVESELVALTQSELGRSLFGLAMRQASMVRVSKLVKELVADVRKEKITEKVMADVRDKLYTQLKELIRDIGDPLGMGHATEVMY